LSGVYDTLVIGAGPAGLFAAIQAARSGRRVGIIEKNSSAGNKFLLTGGRKCNCTHSGTPEELVRHFGGTAKSRFVKHSLYAFSNQDLLSFFARSGVSFTEDEEGKYFPVSVKSGALLSVLVQECLGRSVAIRYGEAVMSIDRVLDGFSVSSGLGRYESKNVVIAAGGAS
jgi:predicted Rossmann fold flavoprotein